MQENLKRNLRIIDVLALGINGVIGSAVFFTLSEIYKNMGPAAVVASLFAAFLCCLIAFCFAEVGSRFTGTGGPYLYAKEAFGDLAGFQVGWMTLMTRIISWAALINAFVMALTPFCPWLKNIIAAQITMVIFMIILAVINMRGVSMGAAATNFFTIAKLLPIALFIIVGIFFIETKRFQPFSPHGYSSIGQTTLVVLYAYVGFEVLTVPAGEMKNPKFSIPFVLVTTMVLVTIVYLLIQVVAIGTLDNLVDRKNPVADAAGVFMGKKGGTLITAGILVSIIGINAGSALVAPRCLYAMAVQKQLPSFLAEVHPERNTPEAAIIVCYTLATLLALSGSFKTLAVISVIARFVQYVPTCLSVFVFRAREQEKKEGFRLPLGPVIPALAILCCVWLITQANNKQLLGGAIAFGSGIPFYFLSKMVAEKNLSEKE